MRLFVSHHVTNASPIGIPAAPTPRQHEIQNTTATRLPHPPPRPNNFRALPEEWLVSQRRWGHWRFGRNDQDFWGKGMRADTKDTPNVEGGRRIPEKLPASKHHQISPANIVWDPNFPSAVFVLQPNANHPDQQTDFNLRPRRARGQGQTPTPENIERSLPTFAP